MMVHDQFKNQDTKFFNQHKNEPIRIPSPNVLPNGQKPDFGNSSRSSKKQAHHNQKAQQRLPNGQMPDFGNSPKNNNNNKKTGASKTNNRPKSNNKNNNNKNNNNQRKSPLSSPKTNSSQINNNNYELSFQKSAPVSAASSSSSKTPSFAGSTFSNSPQTSSIPKPTFL